MGLDVLEGVLVVHHGVLEFGGASTAAGVALVFVMTRVVVLLHRWVLVVAN